MFSYILASYAPKDSVSAQAIRSFVISLRDIKDSAHLRTCKNILELLESGLDQNSDALIENGFSLTLTLVPDPATDTKEDSLEIPLAFLSSFRSDVMGSLEPWVRNSFHLIGDDQSWITRSEETRIMVSLDAQPMIEPNRKQEISSWNIGLTGEHPYSKRDMIKLLRKCGVTDYSLRPRVNEVIILGRKNYDRRLLGKYQPQHPISNGRVFTQESFIEFILFGRDYDVKDIKHNLIKHQCIDYLKRSGSNSFPWPKLSVSRSGERRLIEIEWEVDSELKRLTGYSVAGDKTTVELRRNQLRKGVAVLGLKAVVMHLAWLWRRVVNRKDADFQNALTKWEADLAWLKKNFYKSKNHIFPWPEL